MLKNHPSLPFVLLPIGITETSRRKEGFLFKLLSDGCGGGRLDWVRV